MIEFCKIIKKTSVGAFSKLQLRLLLVGKTNTAQNYTSTSSWAVFPVLWF